MHPLVYNFKFMILLCFLPHQMWKFFCFCFCFNHTRDHICQVYFSLLLPYWKAVNSRNEFHVILVAKIVPQFLGEPERDSHTSKC